MTLMPAILETSLSSGLETYEQFKAFKTNVIWKRRFPIGYSL